MRQKVKKDEKKRSVSSLVRTHVLGIIALPPLPILLHVFADIGTATNKEKPKCALIVKIQSIVKA